MILSLFVALYVCPAIFMLILFAAGKYLDIELMKKTTLPILLIAALLPVANLGFALVNLSAMAYMVTAYVLDGCIQFVKKIWR